MLYSTTTPILATFLALVLLHSHHVSVLAHIPFFEPQLFDASPQGDWTMESPFIIPIDAAAGFSPSLNNSRAITSVLGLTPEDTYDAAMFEISAPGASESIPSQQIIIGLEALAPNCPADSPLSSASSYPSLALLGPSTDPTFANNAPDTSTRETLPFPIPEGYSAIIRNQPRVPVEERGIYSAGPFQSYLLPYPVTPDCITTEQSFATCGSAAKTSIITDVKLTTPGKYFIVWWDPDQLTSPPVAAAPPSTELSFVPGPEGAIARPSVPRQVTISFGVGEDPTTREQELQMEVITGQKVPAFNPCTGSFIAPAVFAGQGITQPPRME